MLSTTLPIHSTFRKIRPHSQREHPIHKQRESTVQQPPLHTSTSISLLPNLHEWQETNNPLVLTAQLSKQDELSISGEDNEVRRVDQDRINRFSRLHQHESSIQEELEALQQKKDDIEEVANELELADEDEPVLFKLGDTFLSLPLTEAQDLLGARSTTTNDECAALETRLSDVREEMDKLRTELYARFGRSINLET